MVVVVVAVVVVVKKGVQAIYGNPSHNYRVSLAVWDHTVLPATRHKRTEHTPPLPQPDRLVLDLPTI